MYDFRVPDIPPENVLSDRFRVHAVANDAMEPTLRGGKDYALLAPVASYEGEGIYLVNMGAGLDLFRVTSSFDGEGGLRLSQENRRLRSHCLTRQQFDALVVGIVVADIKPRDERFLRNA
ncbi:hypothetical protein [Sinorhizobium meliloti]|uniref:hypothetical protein n=1 Tax=Rhizobium meliloti TaxID=382 RepID=UPI000FD809A4|nr:hypothetical protein [Sinorhizobium meliloti]RVO24775.1 hypothetical protein CN095_31250 [Sinorhizobium meliloti]